MTITFFLNVTDTGTSAPALASRLSINLGSATGSWLEIGQTISFFCISSLLLVWSAGICAVGEVLMAGQLRGFLPQRRKAE